MTNLLVLSTTYPLERDDPTPSFVHELTEGVDKSCVDNSIVLAPHHASAKFHEEIDGIEIFRFPYFLPFSIQKLCYEGGIKNNIENSFIAKIQFLLFIPMFIFSAIFLTYYKNIDLVHSHWILPAGLVGVITSFFGPKHILTGHGSDIEAMDNSLVRKIGSRIVKSSDLVTVNSEYTANLLLQNAGIEFNYEILPMGIDIDRFGKEKKINPNGREILSVGRLSEEKGHRYLLKCLKHLNDRDISFNCKIVGGGSLREDLEEMALKLGINNNVEFCGPKNHKELSNFYESADIYVQPSVKEGQGLTVLEASASSTPVVATDVGGLSTMLEDGKTAFICEPQNSKDMADKIEKLFENNSFRSKLAQEGRKHTIENYSWQKICSDLCSLYGGLIGTKN